MNNLLILGAGQFGMMVRELAEDMCCFDLIDFLDDNSEIAVGKISDYLIFKEKYNSAVVAIGNPVVRERLVSMLEDAGYLIADIISTDAYVSASAVLGKGVIIEPMAVLQKGAHVGKASIISSGAVLRHDSYVGSFCHCDCGSVIMSNSTVPDGTKVECLSVFKN